MQMVTARSALAFLFVVSGVAASAACSSGSSAGSGGGAGEGSETDPTDPGAPAGPAGPATSPPRAGDVAKPDGLGAMSGEATPLLVGRFDTRDPSGPLAAWPGVRILARFNGTAVSATMREVDETWMDGAPSYWDVQIDDGKPTVIQMINDNKPHVFALAKGLPPGPHKVELYKRTETQNGVTQFLGFDLHGGRALPPPARQARRIEVIGDSDSAGFGIEMLNAPNLDCPGKDYAGRYQNFRKAWGALLGTRFDAEVHAVVYSGRGVFKSIEADDPETVRAYYSRSNPNPGLDQPPLFDLGSWLPDVIVLYMGGIDSIVKVAPADFKKAYREFVVNQLRPRNPNAEIFLVVQDAETAAMLTEAPQSVAAERKAVGDLKVHALVPKRTTAEEMVACNGHGSPDQHARLAREIGDQIATVTGWK